MNQKNTIDTLSKIIELTNGKRQQNGWYIGKCIAHDDKKPSLSFTQNDNGTFGFKCHAGCTTSSIISSLQRHDLPIKTMIKGVDNTILNIINESKVIKDNDDNPATKYLSKRNIKTLNNKNIMYHSNLNYYDDDSNECSFHPALIFKGITESRELFIQRIYLTNDGHKIGFGAPKKTLGKISGGGIFFDEFETVLAVAEGVETSLSIRQSTGLPTCCVLSSNGMKKFVIPSSVKEFHIFEDKDRSHTGKKSAMELAQKALALKHIETIYIHSIGKDIPEGKKSIDFNDLNDDEIIDIFENKKPFNSGAKVSIEIKNPIFFAGEEKIPFPIDTLPSWQREFVTSISDFIDVENDLVAINSLGVLSISACRAFRIEAKQRYSEPLNLYTMTCLESANRKSEALKHCVAPIDKWHKMTSHSLASDIKKNNLEIELYENELKKLKQEYTRKNDSEKREKIKNEIFNLELNRPDKVTIPSLITNDVTPERLIGLINENYQRQAIFSAEGGFLSTFNGQYNNKPNYEILLKGHSGDYYCYDRVSDSKRIALNDPHIVICTSPQPSIQKDLASIKGASETGLLARFLFSNPKSRLGQRRWNTQTPSLEVINNYETAIVTILEVSSKILRQKDFTPRMLVLSKKASELCGHYSENVIELELRPTGKLYPIKSWGGKLLGNILRIAGLLHISENWKQLDSFIEYNLINQDFIKKPLCGEISVSTFEKAIKIGEYFVSHANAAFSIMKSPKDVEDAKKIWEWIENLNSTEFTQRDIHYALKHNFNRSKDLDIPLNILQERFYIIPKPKSSTGGRPSRIFEINPYFLKKWDK